MKIVVIGGTGVNTTLHFRWWGPTAYRTAATCGPRSLRRN